MDNKQNKFDKVLNDPDVIEKYNEVSRFEHIDRGHAHHDLQHAKNVTNMVEKLLRDLKYDEEFIEEAKIAAILHDTGCNLGKDDHEIRGYEFAKEYIEKKGIELKNKDLVLDAIRLHRNGFDTDNIIALTLIISDKLDIKYTRVAEEGKRIEGMKEYLHIRDIDVSIKDNILKVNFICDSEFNKEEAEKYYFTPKVFKAINTFADKMHLKPLVQINNELWELQ